MAESDCSLDVMPLESSVAKSVYRCDLCDKHCRSERSLQKHLCRHNSRDVIDAKSSVENSVYRCDVCDKHCRSTHSLLKHLHRHGCTDQKCPTCRDVKSVKKQDAISKLGLLKARAKLAKPERFCPVCNKKYYGEKTLSNHVEKKHPEGQQENEDPVKYECIECGSTFASKFNLKRHESLHFPTKPFRCSICSKRFAHIYYLRIHLNSHSEVRRYYCDQCDSVFKTKYGLNKHRKAALRMKEHQIN